MSAPVRFLVVAVAGWVLLRGALAGMLPELGAFAVEKAGATPDGSQVAPADVGPLSEPMPAEVPPPQYDAYYPGPAGYPGYPRYPAYPGYPVDAGYLQPIARYVRIPIYYPAYYSPVRSEAVPLPPLQPAGAAPLEADLFDQLPQPGSFELPRGLPPPPPDWDREQRPRGILAKILPQKHLDRLQLSAWGLFRGTPGTGSLAGAGTLGGSQAGARLTYAIDPRLALSMRSSSPVGGSRGGEVSAGLRLTPFPSIPLAVTAERRQAIGRFSTGRSDFALFAEGGLYQRPVGWGLMLDGYAQAGVVGLKERDMFADGGFALSRPVIGRFSLGLGAWGGYQPGIYRIDAGPRLSMRLRPNISLHLDWRQRLAGAALPSSGPALGVGANF